MVVEEALYTTIVSLIVALLIAIVLYLLPVNEFEKLVKYIYDDIEYMTYFTRTL